MNDLKELSLEEMVEIEGGGWIADAVAWFTASLKCKCDNGGRPGSKGQGGIVGYQMYGG